MDLIHGSGEVAGVGGYDEAKDPDGRNRTYQYDKIHELDGRDEYDEADKLGGP